MSDFGNLVQVALEVERKPFLKDVFEELEPEAYASVMTLLASPFFQFQPFGYYNGVRYGGYEGDGACQVGFLRSMERNKWATAGNRAGKTAFRQALSAYGWSPTRRRPLYRIQRR